MANFYPPMGATEAPAIVCAVVFLSLGLLSLWQGTLTKFSSHYEMAVSGLCEKPSTKTVPHPYTAHLGHYSAHNQLHSTSHAMYQSRPHATTV